MDLPCVIESHKTVDDVNFYKCNNISQMIYVHPNGESNLEDVKGFDLMATK
jgi:TATA-binding protein-associated factor Taf7